METGCGQMLSLRKYYKMMRTSKFSLAKCSWFGTATIVCKHGCPSFIETTHMILLEIVLLKILFWTSRDILQLYWQPRMKSIGNSFIFFLFVCSFHLASCFSNLFFYWMFIFHFFRYYFVMKNKKSYISTNLVYKFFQHSNHC